LEWTFEEESCYKINDYRLIFFTALLIISTHRSLARIVTGFWCRTWIRRAPTQNFW